MPFGISRSLRNRFKVEKWINNQIGNGPNSSGRNQTGKGSKNSKIRKVTVAQLNQKGLRKSLKKCLKRKRD